MHPLLGRQLRKLGFDAQQLPNDCSKWQQFLMVVGRTYANADEDRSRLERSLDVSSKEMLEATQEIRSQAYTDKLTGLSTRTLFMDRMDHALERAKEVRQMVALLFIDVDNFKLVNDSLGHGAGDKLLQYVAEKLVSVARPTDTVARLGGDEFTVLLEGLRGPNDAESVADRIMAEFVKPLTIDNEEIYVGLSVGICYCIDAECSAANMLTNADAAMYQAKARGGAAYLKYSKEMDTDALERLELETALRKALEHNEIQVVYQPLVDLESGQVIGAEALARWNNAQRGFVPPAVFIPIAEQKGLITAIGYYILEQACAQMRLWLDKYTFPQAKMSVNMSVRQMEQPDAVDRVKAILEKTGLEPQYLCLEITESLLITDSQSVLSQIMGLKKLGVKIAVDDFGTGYSSLATLSWYPVDMLKIDKAFIMPIGESEGSTAIIEAIVALAKTMKLGVIGEGVETKYQMEFIRKLGCATAQGYFFSKPLSVADFEQTVEKFQLSNQQAA